MKKVVSIIITALISLVTVFVLTTLFEKRKENKLLIHKLRDSIVSCVPDTTKKPVVINKVDTSRNSTNVSVREDGVSDYEILQSIEKAQLYLNSSTKTKDGLNFHKMKLKNQFRIKGLSKKTNEMLFSTIIKINKELEKLNKSRKDTDSLKVKKVHNDSLQFKRVFRSDTIN